VKYFASQPQLQERLTQQVADFLFEKIKPKGCMLVVEAVHTCTSLRGIKTPSKMVTSALRGEFLKDPDLKEEVLKLLWHSE
jgi:GTP cyclohydrolase I